jgi:predicted TIM-barrel fold metal-dependent hydrolase
MLGNFDVIDVHHHVGDPSAVLGSMPLSIQPDEPADAASGEVAKRLEVMARGGVDQAVVIPGHGYFRADGLRDTMRINDGIAAYRDGHPTHFPVAIGVVEPTYGPHALPEIDRVADDLHLAGISFHVRFQGVSLDNQWVRTYLERIVERGLTPVLHAVHETSENALWKVATIGRAFPDAEILVLDAFGSHEGTKECFFTAEVAPNLVFDTSLAQGWDLIEHFARTFGAERVAFGTDLYSWPLGRRISPIAEQIAACGMDDRSKELMLAGNARRLFRLPEPAGPDEHGPGR